MDADAALAEPRRANAALVFEALEDTRDESVALVGFPMPKGHGGPNVIDLDMKEPKDFPKKRREVAGVGTGAVAFRLDWYRAHWPADDALPWFQTVIVKEGGDIFHIGEDYGHCGLVRRRGGKVVIDPRAQWKHHTARAGSAEARARGA
jgi:hypothetical protein